MTMSAPAATPEMVPAKVETTAASKAILQRLHPGRTEMGAGEAMADVRAVLDFERVLRDAAAECPKDDWRAIAAVTLRVMRSRQA